MKPAPLPHGMADKLIAHMDSCYQCKRAKIQKTPLCQVAKDLVRATTKERHG